MLKIKNSKLFFIFLLLFLLGANFVLAQGNETGSLSGYIKYIVNFLIMLSGVVAFCALIYGGILYLTSVGDPERIRKAKDQIFASLLGLFIVLLSYIILTTLSPQLVILKTGLEKIPELKKIIFPILEPAKASCDKISGLKINLLGSKEFEEMNLEKLKEIAQKELKEEVELKDEIGLINYEIIKVYQGLELATQSERLFQQTKKVIELTELCNCKNTSPLCDFICGIAPCFVKCMGNPCPKELDGAISNLKNQIVGGERFIYWQEEKDGKIIGHGFEPIAINNLIQSKEAQKLESTLTQMSYCRANLAKTLLLCGIAKEWQVKKECEELDFYCCY